MHLKLQRDQGQSFEKVVIYHLGFEYFELTYRIIQPQSNLRLLTYDLDNEYNFLLGKHGYLNRHDCLSIALDYISFLTSF